MPLIGKTILVTSAGRKGEDFCAKLKDLGAEALLMPMIEITPPDSWQQLDKAISALDSYQWLLFASSNAVISFAERVAHHQGLNWQNLETAKKILPTTLTKTLPKIAVIGQKTADLAGKYGIKVDYCPNNYLAEDFIAQFPGYPKNLAGINILWPRTNLGRDFITEKLLAASAKVEVVPAYKTGFPANALKLNKRLQELIENKNLHAITIASKQTALNLAKVLCFEIMGNDISRNLPSATFPTEEAVRYLKELLANILIVTIGPEASEGALNYLGKVNLTAEPHTVDGIINVLIEFYRSKGEEVSN